MAVCSCKYAALSHMSYSPIPLYLGGLAFSSSCNWVLTYSVGNVMQISMPPAIPPERTAEIKQMFYYKECKKIALNEHFNWAKSESNIWLMFCLDSGYHVWLVAALTKPNSAPHQCKDSQGGAITSWIITTAPSTDIKSTAAEAGRLTSQLKTNQLLLLRLNDTGNQQFEEQEVNNREAVWKNLAASKWC